MTPSPSSAAGLSPTELVLQRYTLPFTLHPKQVWAINELAPLLHAGFWLDMGTGKTVVSTVCALYQSIVWGYRVVVIMPPLLIRQWDRWLRSLKPAPTVVAYRGSPKQRAEMDLRTPQFVLVGIQIFKRDYERFQEAFGTAPRTVILDEATIIANIESANHEYVVDFSAGCPVMPLTGTPMNKPSDAYGLLKFSAPGTYRSKKQFENLHVADRDFYGMPTEWQNLDRLAEALQKNSVRILYGDMYSDIDEPLFTPIEYDLEDEHDRLYRRLVNEQMLTLPNGEKIDGTTANRLRHALGQVVVNFGHFCGNPDKKSAGLQIIEEKLQELGDGKLVVFADYRMTVRNLVSYLQDYGAVGINSEVTEKQKDKNVDRFINDPKCRVIVIQFISGGKGLDGLQHVCHTCMFIEPCMQPRDFHQAVARLKRTGQKKRVQVLLPIAQGTLQVRGFRKLIENDTLVNQVVRNATELRLELLGGRK